MNPSETVVKGSTSAAAHSLHRVLRGAVERQLVADVPVGVFLSGGLDSAILATLTADIQGSERTHAFSLGFPKASRGFDETKDAREVATALGCRHTVLEADEDDLLGAIDEVVRAYDEPFADAAALPVFLLSRMAKRYVGVCLSGEGADELFGGYRRYSAEHFVTGRALGRRVLRAVGRSGWRQATEDRRLRTMIRAAWVDDPARRYATYLAVLDDKTRRALTQPEWWADGHEPSAAFNQRDPRHDGKETLGSVERLCLLDQRLWMVDTYLEKTDKASMASSLEVRVPYLDREVVAFANALPDRWRINGRDRKHLLRLAFRDLVPPAVISKPKRGFSVPVGEWFRGPLKDTLEHELLRGDAQIKEYVRQDVIRGLIHEHAAKAPDRSDALWALYVFARWLACRADRAD